MADRRIGILGSGDVGQALGRGFAGRGWDVRLGTRSPEKLEGWLDETRKLDEIEGAGTDAFAGKLVLDATNPLDFSDEGPPGLLYSGTDSLGERLQTRLPAARVVKCFNTVSNDQMVDPAFEEGTPPMLICGDDAGEKRRTEEVLVAFGWPAAIDVGGIEAARYLEALVPPWVRVGSGLGTWEHAFEAVR